jgi:hypothetical protein
MELEIRRRYSDNQTFGTLYLYNENNGVGFSCNTLELKWDENKQRVSCIPEGEYVVKVRYSEKYKRHLHITDVVNRSFILVHWGNYAGSINPRTGKSDILGCVLVGERYVDIDGDGIKDITSSKNTFDKLMSFIEDDDAEIPLKIHSV